LNDYLKIIMRIGVGVCALLALSGLPLIFAPKYSQMHSLAGRRDDIQNKVEMKQREIQAIRRRQHLFATDPEFVEHIARQNRRVRPDELVFVFDAVR
jgi:hypothetical protein